MEISDYELLLDSLQTAGVYVIRTDNHQILYFNKWMQKAVPDIRLGTVRHELWIDPLSGGRGESADENVSGSHPLERTARIEASEVLWEKRIPASIVTVIPYKEKSEEKEYISKSLGSLFFAIYDIDLEEDIFRMISQRKEVGDILGEEISFTEAIRIYSEHFVYPDFRAEYERKMGRQNLLDELGGDCPLAVVEYRRVKKDFGKILEEDGWVRQAGYCRDI